MARPREAVGCRTLICRKADSGQLNDLATYTLWLINAAALVVGDVARLAC